MRAADGAPALAPGGEAIDAALDGRLAATLGQLGATGKAGEHHRVATFGATAAPQIVAVGLGDAPRTRRASLDPEQIRRGAGVALRELAGATHVVLALPATGGQGIRPIAEGALLGAYSYRRYRNASKPDHRDPVETITVITDDARSADAKRALARAEIVAEAVNTTRDLVNTPPSDLHPKEFADFANGLATENNLDIEILDERQLRRQGYGGITAVGQGSINPPRLVRMTYRRPRAKKTIALVGKGITFDSGGLSLKPTASMDWMKSDMGGAAAIVLATVAVAQLKLNVNVTAWAPLAENMPSGSAQRPSDVLTIYGGKTVEVLNTDAEGRLVLADALVTATEQKPDVIVDVATLTGACVIALGDRVGGVLGNDEALVGQVTAAGDRAGEALWPLPIPEEMTEKVRTASKVADLMQHNPDKWGGTLFAAAFLQEFVGDHRWAHLDIAGPAFNEKSAHGYTTAGGTGFAVPTLVELARELAG